ncbi:helix-turn-helix domain-containing protein [Microlunatus lacustris]
MDSGTMSGSGPALRPPDTTEAWVADVAEAAARDVGAPANLLGEYLVMLADAALTGRRPPPSELAAVRTLGQRAAEQGVDAKQAVDLYLTAAWRLWQEIPAVVRTRDRDKVSAAAAAVLRVVNDAVEVMVEGHQAARQQMIRHEESVRREFIDDLLRGDADVSRLVRRAEPLGLDLARPHQVLLAAASSRADVDRAASLVQRAVVERFGDREILVAMKDDLLAVVVPADHPASAAGQAEPADYLQRQLSQQSRTSRWQVGAGRPYPGAYGIARSYEEAREALLLAHRLQLTSNTVHARDLLVYRVLGRDHDALADLVQATLEPLTRARGGAVPLLQTLHTYFETGAVATETARQLHMSVRTVTYRLSRVAALTGHDATDPRQRLPLQIAVIGARLLDWPHSDSPST